MGDEHCGRLSSLGSKQTLAEGRVRGEFKSLEENIKPSLMISDEKIAGWFLFLLRRRHLYRRVITYRRDLPAPTCWLPCYSISSTIAKTCPCRLLSVLLNGIFSCLSVLKFFFPRQALFWIDEVKEHDAGIMEESNVCLSFPLFHIDETEASILAHCRRYTHEAITTRLLLSYPSHMAVCISDVMDSVCW